MMVIVATFDANLHAVEWPDEKLAQQSPEAKQVLAKMEADDEAGALKLAEKLARKHPDVVDLPVLIGAIQAGSGNYDQAFAAWKRAVLGRDTDVVPLAMMARLHEERAELGPGGVRIGGGVRYDPKGMKTDRDAFVRAEYLAGAECLAQILARQPRAYPYQVKRLEFLVAAKDFAAARSAGEGYLKLMPDNGELWRLVAQAEIAGGDFVRARVAAEQAVRLQPNSSGACKIMADVMRHAGDPEADSWVKRARFNAFVPDFLVVSFTPENVARIDTLCPFNFDDFESYKRPDRATWKKNQDAARQVIDELIARKDRESSHLLAAIAWNHSWHGELENAIFAELEQRRVEPLLVSLFDHAESTCTVGGAALALARMKSEAVFAAMVERLPQDRTMFPMRLPEALAIYQRPETVRVIAGAMRTAVEDERRAGSGVMAMMAGMGTRLFIKRCLWSLAAFKTPAARQVLEEMSKERDWEIDATAALYALTGEQRTLDLLLKRLKREPKGAEGIADRLRYLGLEPAAKAIELLIPKEEKK